MRHPELCKEMMVDMTSTHCGMVTAADINRILEDATKYGFTANEVMSLIITNHKRRDLFNDPSPPATTASGTSETAMTAVRGPGSAATRPIRQMTAGTRNQRNPAPRGVAAGNNAGSNPADRSNIGGTPQQPKPSKPAFVATGIPQRPKENDTEQRKPTTDDRNPGIASEPANKRKRVSSSAENRQRDPPDAANEQRSQRETGNPKDWETLDAANLVWNHIKSSLEARDASPDTRLLRTRLFGMLVSHTKGARYLWEFLHHHD
ncbi:Uu.00g026030.m01.CDS01 [Anthostomella pinea]|uniref:Uu.00g026030.m01.CDS01 n=1 Tax=Anthostomella pinea TaxID=933095 RepID=A0AAI8V8G4_9PEZI|nr:Uu.00g026030.m01.CDS01 [Anthostomella pinea]